MGMLVRVFLYVMFCNCLNVVSSMLLIVSPVSTINFTFSPLIFSLIVGALLYGLYLLYSITVI